MPSLFIELSPVISPAVFLPRPSSLSRNPIVLPSLSEETGVSKIAIEKANRPEAPRLWLPSRRPWRRKPVPLCRRGPSRHQSGAIRRSQRAFRRSADKEGRRGCSTVSQRSGRSRSSPCCWCSSSAVTALAPRTSPAQRRFFVELHTHDPSGIIHLEAPKKGVFTLGQFVGVWGVRLSKQCIGGYCAAPGKPLKFYVNGKRFLGNPNNIVLHQHDEYAIVYGKPPAKIPSTYDWGPSGL